MLQIVIHVGINVVLVVIAVLDIIAVLLHVEHVVLNNNRIIARAVSHIYFWLFEFENVFFLGAITPITHQVVFSYFQ